MGCRMEMSDDPESVKNVRKCDDGMKCVYEEYNQINKTDSKCILKSEYGT